MLDRLVAEELQADLGSAVIGREIIVLEQTGSTNDAILQVATADSNEGLVLFAEHQTRRTRSAWQSMGIRGRERTLVLDTFAAKDRPCKFATTHYLGGRSRFQCNRKRISSQAHN